MTSFRAAKPGIFLGLSLALAAHLWMQVDGHPMQVEVMSTSSTPMEDGITLGTDSGLPEGEEMLSTVVAMCLVVMTGAALRFAAARVVSARVVARPSRRVPGAQNAALLRHPPRTGSLFARSVPLLR